MLWETDERTIFFAHERGSRPFFPSVSLFLCRTEVCNFSGFKIYPGHGSRFARTDEKVFNFINGKSKACQKMKRKPVKLNWTQLYRRVNKKGAQEETVKRRTRKVNTVVMKPVEGASLEVIKAKRNQQQRSKTTGAKAANLK